MGFVYERRGKPGTDDSYYEVGHYAPRTNATGILGGPISTSWHWVLESTHTHQKDALHRLRYLNGASPETA